LSRNAAGLAGRWVSFDAPTGNVQFLDGLVGPGGSTTLAATDANGDIAMRFLATADGAGTIHTQALDGTPASDCTFEIKDVTDVGEGEPANTTLSVTMDRGDAIEIRYSIAGIAGPISLDVFDIAGRHIRTLERGMRSPGTYVSTWDRRADGGGPITRGIYMVRLRQSSGSMLTRKVALLRR
jgi:hypothetical protein